jgi:hypothetical protein
VAGPLCDGVLKAEHFRGVKMQVQACCTEVQSALGTPRTAKPDIVLSVLIVHGPFCDISSAFWWRKLLFTSGSACMGQPRPRRLLPALPCPLNPDAFTVLSSVAHHTDRLRAGSHDTFGVCSPAFSCQFFVFELLAHRFLRLLHTSLESCFCVECLHDGCIHRSHSHSALPNDDLPLLFTAPSQPMVSLLL